MKNNTDYKKEIITILKKINAIKYGNFVLKDGSSSSVYIDLRIIPNFPDEFRQIIDITNEYFKSRGLVENVDGLTAPPLAGIPLGVALALKLNKSFYLIRKKQKEHGTKKLVEGIIENKRIMVIDDVITSGGSKEPIIETIIANKGKIAGLFVFVNRVHNPSVIDHLTEKYNIKVDYLLTLDDILQFSP